MPTNLYGIGDNYHPKNSHVIPSLIRKIHLAKTKNLEKLKFGDLVMFIENFYLQMIWRNVV